MSTVAETLIERNCKRADDKILTDYVGVKTKD